LTADLALALAQAIAKGLLTGMVYGLMALGLSVIFGVMRVVNFAHGEMMVVGMYLAWMGFEYLGVTPLLSLPAIAVLFFFAGYALQRSLISPFIGRPEHQQFLLLLAVAILLVNAALAIAGGLTVALYLRRGARRGGSDLVRAEAAEWLLDTLLSVGVLVGFLIALVLESTGHADLAAYVDPGMVAITSAGFNVS
jgi:branched-subunit amino acid ABC-type transport system permease component